MRKNSNILVKKKWIYTYTPVDPSKPVDGEKNKYRVEKRDLLFKGKRYERLIKFPEIVGEERTKMLIGEHPDIQIDPKFSLPESDIEFIRKYGDKTGYIRSVPTVSLKEIIGWGGYEFPLLTVEKLLKVSENAEVRTELLREYGFERFVLNSGGKCVLEPKGADYPNASIYEVELKMGRTEMKSMFLKMINQTVEHEFRSASEEERVGSGLDRDGKKIYVVGIPYFNWPSVFHARAWVSHIVDIKDGDLVPYQPSIASLTKQAKESSGKELPLEYAKELQKAFYESNRKILKTFEDRLKSSTLKKLGQYNLEIEA